jgi:hypothetical protein
MGSLSSIEQRKLAYFHALGKVMTENTQAVYESQYKSSHNVRLNEVWSDDIAYAVDYSSAVSESVSNSAVTLINQGDLTQIFGSNGQSYNFFSGSTFVRPWISPVDIPHPVTNLPSFGYEVRLFDGSGSEIYLTEGAWSVDYYAGIIHFAEGYTPSNMGWGSIKATFFQYTGNYGTSDPTLFKTVTFNSGTTELIFNQGTSYEQSVNLSFLDNSEAFVNATFNSGTSIITLTDGDGNTTDVDLSVIKSQVYNTATFYSGTTSIVFNEGELNEKIIDLSYLDNIDSYVSAEFNSGTSIISFTDGEGYITSIDLSSLKNVSGSTSAMSPSNTNMSVNTTNYMNSKACNTPINNGNVSNSIVCVYVNGVQVNVGNSINDDCYFSGDGGVTERIPGTEQIGDFLYWNYDYTQFPIVTPIVGYELNSSIDKMTFIYLTI